MRSAPARRGAADRVVVDVEVVNRSGVELDEGGLVALARDVLAEEGVLEGELGLVLVTPEEIRRLKREHLGIDEATDVLAFPIDGLDDVPPGVPRALGDVVLCPALLRESWRAPLVHGLLHLLGHEHGPAMEARERAHLER